MLNTIKLKIRKFIRKNRELLSRFHFASKMASMVALLVIIPLGIDKPNSYQTEIKLNDRSDDPLVLTDKSVNVISVPSRADVDDSIASLDPNAIKALMQELAPEYGVDWKLVYAIGTLESGNFSSSLARSQFNFFGRKAPGGGYASWNNPEDAIRNQFVYLKTRYLDRGMDTPYEMNHVYAESPTWGAKVTAIMERL